MPHFRLKKVIGMRMYKIEIDEEVYSYLKEKAEPFIDSPNTILRRELFNNSGNQKLTKQIVSRNIKDVLPTIPAGTPKMIEEILQVVYLTQNLNLSRSDATHKVAALHQVSFQTIIDKYTRQLNLTAYQFDKLLDQSNLTDLKSILWTRFSDHQSVIKDYLGDEKGKYQEVEDYTLNQLANKSLSSIKPAYIEIEKSKIDTKSWSDLCVKFVTWLVQNNYLTYNHLPIHNSSHRNKYFINNKPEHADPNKDGEWKQVNGFFIDVKYPAKVHIKNLMDILHQLNLDTLNVKIGFID